MNIAEIRQLETYLDDIRINLHLMADSGVDTFVTEKLVESALELVRKRPQTTPVDGSVTVLKTC